MINITLQRNDTKDVSDTVSHTDDTITINGTEYAFSEGKNVNFISPHEQIINPHRDSDGVLCAVVIAQYVKSDKETAENNKETFLQRASMARIADEKFNAEILKEEVKEKTVAELISEKESEVLELRNLYIDADIDDEESTKKDLKDKIRSLKSEISSLNKDLEAQNG